MARATLIPIVISVSSVMSVLGRPARPGQVVGVDAELECLQGVCDGGILQVGWVHLTGTGQESLVRMEPPESCRANPCLRARGDASVGALKKLTGDHGGRPYR
jgi:hypothetical protein